MRQLTHSRLLCCWLAGLLCCGLSGHVGATVVSDRLQQLLDHLVLQPLAEQPELTFIIESSAPRPSIQATIQAAAGKLRYSRGRLHEVRMLPGRVPQLLARLPVDAVARLPYPHVPTSVTSLGVSVSGAADMQALGQDGSGIKIGIIDIGFGSLATSQSNGELPATGAGLTITDYTGTGTGGDSHGTNVAEIVHDMAPGAELHLAKIDTETELAQALDDMIAAGVQVVNHSVAWFGTAFYDGSGPLCDITNTAENSGVLWVNAAGNYRSKHYLGTFADTDGDGAHDFAAGQNYNTVTLNAGGSAYFILNWDDYANTSIDYNLYLYDGDPAGAGVIVAASENAQSGKGPHSYPYPYEELGYTASASGTYYLVVKKPDPSSSNLPLTLFSPQVNLGIKTQASSLAQPADCASALAIAATDAGNDAVAGYSSQGPTVDGRNKPEISAPTAVQTSLSGFAGTSAAAPHATGAAGLLWGQNPGLTLAGLRSALQDTAHDLSPGGYDLRTGFGRISLDADGDGSNHDDDNCVLVVNGDQLDTDSDGDGNACDSDDDNDGLPDSFEQALGTDPLLVDSDGDTLSDFDEVNWDGDPNTYTPGLDLNPLAIDTDGDGISDNQDPEPLVSATVAGDIAPLGAPDGLVNAADYLVCLRVVLGIIDPPYTEIQNADLYPPGSPDNIIDLSDLILLQGLVLQP